MIFITWFNQVMAQSFSIQRDFVGEFEYQNIPDLSIDFQKYKLQYKFEKPFLVQLNSESWGYDDVFSNRIDYTYIGIGLGTYVHLFKQLQVEFGLAYQVALNRKFGLNTNLNSADNKGSLSDIEKKRSFIFGNIVYEHYIYKMIGLSLGIGIQSILNPYRSSATYAYNSETNQVNNTDNFTSGVSLMYTINFGIIYRLN